MTEDLYGLTGATVDRLRRLLGEQPGATASAGRGVARGRDVTLVKCTSATAVGGGANSEGDQCYPAKIIVDDAGVTEPTETVVCYLTLWESAGASVPVEGGLYIAVLSGFLDLGSGPQRRAFGVVAVLPDSERPSHARLTTSSGGLWKFVKLKLSSSGVYVDDGGESAGYTASPLKLDDDPTHICKAEAGLRVLMLPSKQKGRQEFIPINMADESHPGLMSTGPQTFSGPKGFDHVDITHDMFVGEGIVSYGGIFAKGVVQADTFVAISSSRVDYAGGQLTSSANAYCNSGPLFPSAKVLPVECFPPWIGWIKGLSNIPTGAVIISSGDETPMDGIDNGGGNDGGASVMLTATGSVFGGPADLWVIPNNGNGHYGAGSPNWGRLVLAGSYAVTNSDGISTSDPDEPLAAYSPDAAGTIRTGITVNIKFTYAGTDYIARFMGGILVCVSTYADRAACFGHFPDCDGGTGTGVAFVSYDCFGGTCVQAIGTSGEYATLADCKAGCGEGVSYDCVDGTCTELVGHDGTYATLADCQADCGDGGISVTYVATRGVSDNSSGSLTATSEPVTVPAGKTLFIVAAVTGNGTNATVNNATFGGSSAFNSGPVGLKFTGSGQKGHLVLFAIPVATTTTGSIAVTGNAPGGESKAVVFTAFYVDGANPAGPLATGAGLTSAPDWPAGTASGSPNYILAASLMFNSGGASAGSWSGGFVDAQGTTADGGKVRLQTGDQITLSTTSFDAGLTGTTPAKWLGFTVGFW